MTVILIDDRNWTMYTYYQYCYSKMVVIPGSRVLTKPIVTQLVKIFSAFYDT
jgi:hypothetical protein